MSTIAQSPRAAPAADCVADQEARDLVDRLLRRRQADAHGRLRASSAASRSSDSARWLPRLFAGERVDLVDDDGARRREHLAARLRAEQHVQRLGRRDDDVRRPLAHARALALRRVAGAHQRADVDVGQARAPRARARMPASGTARLLLDVVGQRLQRRDVDDERLVGQRRRRRPGGPARRWRPGTRRASCPSRWARRSARCCPAWISGHARACAGVGAGNWPANQAATAGWNEWGMGYFLTSRQSGNRRAATRLIRWLIRGRCANLDCCFPRQTAFATDEACTASAADDAADGYFCRPAARATVQLFAARRRRQAGAGGARRAYRRRAVHAMPRRSQGQEDHGGDRRAAVERLRRGASSRTTAPHYQAINERLHALGLRTYTPEEIRRQIAQAEIDAYFTNDPDAALSASQAPRRELRAARPHLVAGDAAIR